MSLLHRTGSPTHDVYSRGFYPTSWDFTVRAILGKSSRGGSDVGEVLSTIAPVQPDDHTGWFEAWLRLGRRVAAIAQDCAAAGHRVSASRAYLRAANYLGVATGAVDGLDGDESQLLPTFREHRQAWEGFLATTGWPVERVAIPYQGDGLPGWFFRPGPVAERRATVVMNNGSDGSVSGLWCQGSQAALERGYNVLMFDGPGQQSMLFEHGMPFRHDWEAVLTPVVDALLARPDVDPARLAVVGLSQAGYWVPRALAFEHRFAAAVADGGVVDVARGWRANIPGPLLAMYDRGDRDGFERDMSLGFRLPGSRSQRHAWAFRARPYGTSGYAVTLDEVSKYDLSAVAGQVSTPLLITDPDQEQFFAGQPAELHALVPHSELVRFAAQDGASFHCQPMARELTEQRVFDWLDERLDPRAVSPG